LVKLKVQNVDNVAIIELLKKEDNVKVIRESLRSVIDENRA
jgi:hypothetical protein